MKKPVIEFSFIGDGSTMFEDETRILGYIVPLDAKHRIVLRMPNGNMLPIGRASHSLADCKRAISNNPEVLVASWEEALRRERRIQRLLNQGHANRLTRVPN